MLVSISFHAHFSQPTSFCLSLLIFVCTAMQVFQIPLDSEVTIRWLYLRHLSHKVLLASQILVRTTKVVLGISGLNYHAFSLGADLLSGNVTNELSNEVHYILDNSMFIQIESGCITLFESFVSCTLFSCNGRCSVRWTTLVQYHTNVFEGRFLGSLLCSIETVLCNHNSSAT